MTGSPGPGDRALVNARLPGATEPQALILRAGRIAAVGPLEELRSLIRKGVDVIDVGGHLAVPGLYDSHIHAVRAGLTYRDRPDWAGVRSLREAIAGLTEFAGKLEPGNWIAVVGGWHPGQFDEGRGPTTSELTAACPEHPVYVQLLYEEARLNRAALAAIGIDRSSPDPPMGWFERDAEGNPTGLMRGVGAFGVCLAAAGQPGAADAASSTEAFFRRLNQLGLTTVLDPGGFGMRSSSYRPVYELWRRNDLTLRIRMFLMPSTRGNELAEVRELVEYVHPRFGDDMLRVVGMGEVLVYGLHDLEGVRPFEVQDEHRRELAEIIRLLVQHDWPVHQHAVLDSTVSAVLDVWEEIGSEVPLAGRRFALAHAEPVSDRNLERVAAIGAGIAIQSRMVFRAQDSADFWGADVLAEAPPLRSILEKGIPLGAGTDATAVSSYSPWQSIWWLVTGRSIDGAAPRDLRHRLSRQEALDAYTVGSSWFSFDEHQLGALRPGMSADLAILSDDYFTIPEDEIPDLRSLVTIVGGDVVWSDPAAGLAPEDGSI